MDYRKLAGELVQTMYMVSKGKPQRRMNDCMRGEGFVLQYVIFRGEPVQPNEITGFMNISSARTAAALNNLERKGLLTRRIDSGDRRRIQVELTDEGKKIAEAQRNDMLDHMTRLVERLGEQDATEFVRIMGRVADLVTEMHADHDKEDAHDSFERPFYGRFR